MDTKRYKAFKKCAVFESGVILYWYKAEIMNQNEKTRLESSVIL